MMFFRATAEDPIFAVRIASLKLREGAERQMKSFPVNQTPYTDDPKRSGLSNRKACQILSLSASHRQLRMDFYEFGPKFFQTQGCLFSGCNCNARTACRDAQYRVK